MRVTVFGATGAIGQKVVAEALSAGHTVRAFTRDAARLPADAGITPVVGDLADPARIRAAIEGSEAVIWAVGATANTPDQPPLFEAAARSAVDAMRALGVRRLVALSGAGITLAGERKPLSGRLMTAIVGVLARHVVEAKRREYEIFSRSGLDWTIVRPPRVAPGPAGRTFHAGSHLQGRTVSDGTLARFMVLQLTDPTYIGGAPYISV